MTNKFAELQARRRAEIAALDTSDFASRKNPVAADKTSATSAPETPSDIASLKYRMAHPAPGENALYDQAIKHYPAAKALNGLVTRAIAEFTEYLETHDDFPLLEYRAGGNISQNARQMSRQAIEKYRKIADPFKFESNFRITCGFVEQALAFSARKKRD